MDVLIYLYSPPLYQLSYHELIYPASKALNWLQQGCEWGLRSSCSRSGDTLLLEGINIML